MRPRLEVMTDLEVRSMSFGLVHNPVFPCPESWQEQKSSLFDQRIFGAEADDRCACGKYRGVETRGIICDVCGVKIGEAAVMRKGRFGHIDLGRQMPHPWFEDFMIEMIPVLPIAYRTDNGRTDWDYLYARVIRAAGLSEQGGGSPQVSEADALRLAVRQLLENERTEKPAMLGDRCVQSLGDYIFEAPGLIAQETGVYLAALMLKVVV